MFSLIIDLFTVLKSVTAVVSAVVTWQSAPSLSTSIGVEKTTLLRAALWASQLVKHFQQQMQKRFPRRSDPALSLIKALLRGSALETWRAEPCCSRGLDGMLVFLIGVQKYRVDASWGQIFVGWHIVPEYIAINNIIVHIPPQAVHCQSSSPKVKDSIKLLVRGRRDGTTFFPKSIRFISHIHLEKGHTKTSKKCFLCALLK